LRRLLKRRPEVAEAVQVTLAALSEDAFDPILKTHKLSGDLQSIGTHDEAY
jgi:mRNA-degrading endonuclease YafQ of YafQ-DinJ toxin-antitoxin module